MYMGIDVGAIIKTQLILCSLCVFNNVPLCHVSYPIVRGPGLSGLVILCCPLCGASQVSQQGFWITTHLPKQRVRPILLDSFSKICLQNSYL